MSEIHLVDLQLFSETRVRIYNLGLNNKCHIQTGTLAAACDLFGCGVVSMEEIDLAKCTACQLREICKNAGVPGGFSRLKKIDLIEFVEANVWSPQDYLVKLPVSKLLKDRYPEIYAQIDREKNALDGIKVKYDNLTCGLRVLLWWKCEGYKHTPGCSHHRWKTRVSTRTSGNWCPFCVGLQRCDCVTLVTHRQCSRCHVEKPVSNFHSCKSKVSGKQSFCKDCSAMNTKDYIATEKGFISKCLASAKHSAKVRKEKGREDAGNFNLTSDIIFDKLEQQNNCCFYSGLPLVLKQFSHWQMSLERLDNNEGYTVENTVLICLEFQTSNQWNLDKIRQLPVLINSPVHSTFYESLDDICKLLTDKYYCCETEGGKIMRKKLQRLYKDAKYHANIKSISVRIGNRIDVDLVFLIQLLKLQQGRCYYSGIPLQFEKGDWRISLERKNVFKGYTKDNVALICQEFNSCDQTVKSKDSTSGSCGWSSEKFKYFLEHSRTATNNA
jgi:Probable Zinc-ribbon domain